MIRKMTLEDISEVYAIESVTFNPGWTISHFEYELRDNPYANLYVLEKNNEIVGYIGFWILFDQAQITTIAVKEKYRGNYFGDKLLLFAINNIKSYMCENITLEVRKSNVTAQKLYEKHGFVKLGERKNYYENEDAILMGIGI